MITETHWCREHDRGGRHVTALLILLLLGVCSACTRTRLPQYEAHNDEEHVIDSVSVGLARGSLLKKRPADIEKLRIRSLGSTYKLLNKEELSGISPPTARSEVRIEHALRGKYYNLWSIVERLQRDPEPVVPIFEFQLVVGEGQDPYLGIGCADSVVVYVNGQAVFAVCGARESRYTHHVFRLPVKLGENQIKIAFEKDKEWTVPPAEHWDDEWSANVQIFGGSNYARKMHAQRVAHPLTSPVVRGLEDFTVESSWGDAFPVELYDIDQHLRARGKSTDDGRVAWEAGANSDIDYPFAGILSVIGVGAEPIVVCGQETISSGLAILGDRINGESGPWAYRAKHLLKPEYETNRDVWWARKFAMSVVKASSHQESEEKANILASCPAMRFEFGSYLSKIDGTKQYYRYYRSLKHLENRRTLIIVPTVPTPVRPFLESYTMADLNSAEAMAATADAEGVDLIWVGGACVDYGGNLARADVFETWEDYRSRFSTSISDSVFLLGTCSSGVSALGVIANGMSVDGVVLWSPTIHRRTYRWKPGTKVLPELPDGVLKAEQTDVDLSRYLGPRILIYYDNDAEGHGNRMETRKFIDKLTALGGKVDSVWVEPAEKLLLWGVRERISIEEWMHWVATAPRTRSKDEVSTNHPTKSSSRPSTLKDALLNGMRADDSFRRSQYAIQWLAAMRSYRGQSSELGSVNDESAKLSYRHASAKEIIATYSNMRELTSLLPEANIPTMGSGVNDEQVWGARLLPGQGAPVIEITTNISESDLSPPVDLLVDGCCAALLYVRNKNAWSIRQVYLKASTKGGEDSKHDNTAETVVRSSEHL